MAVDGLLAGLAAGLIMALFLVIVGLLDRASPTVTLGYFDPAQAGSWLTGLLAHLAVSAIYGVLFALLAQAVAWVRPSFWRRPWLWGVGYGLLLLALAYGVIFPAVASPLEQIAAWQFGPAHVFYGLVLGLWLGRNQ